MNRLGFRFAFCLIAILPLFGETGAGFLPGKRVLLDAHNCYPYNGRYTDRITRALESGVPVAIEIDLAWYSGERTGAGRIIVTHGTPYSGREPGLKDYFFETIRPVVENALKSGDRKDWPIIVLNINDLRGQDPAFYRAVWDLAGEYEGWLCTAPKRAREEDVAPIDVKPVLILTNGGGGQYQQFYGGVPIGGRLRMFGVAQDAQPPSAERQTAEERDRQAVAISPEKLLPQRATNFRRWCNNSWHAVELGGASKAGAWTEADAARLRGLVDHGHKMGYWVRFYTLDAFTANTGEWGEDYNFGSLEAARVRWEASTSAGVDFIATDQIEELAAFLRAKRK
jgi:hypothetical protein